MIKLNAAWCGLIGDALVSVPWMKYLCDKHDTDAAVVGGFNRHVAEVLAPSYPFLFDETATGAYAAEYNVHIGAMWNLMPVSHMTQCFFRNARVPEPELPLSLDLRCEPSGLPPGMVISPYSRSNSPNNNKFWPHDRWISVIRALRDGGQIDRVYVVGASSVDDPSAYVAEDVEPVFDRPLSQVLSLMRSSPLVMTLDNGIAHLAHYGGVENLVLLYPGCLSAHWVHNPRAVEVHAAMPIDIPPVSMLQAARMVLGRPNALSRCI